ncbi:hypothetical protein P175DRAFT_0259403 [Aspergillus ochraceoroseus IBT 24754]|uniref:Zn(2)-C6 fungal-type domain-containing protein n=1 Tax=Aspergillus ochraceoroseus IBT 24754 TaxID=1392256 RepID=A0A2T5LUE1_9EURO|nr:uncharacterized protein P175DRAFT_0259403 [Aspergillus ochraceoroseus IBT 24754]PTU19890.1 hypothetical protein P175DRAFT_0259403 [Aspergillus ochraceoroseus IBT 24754]
MVVKACDWCFRSKKSVPLPRAPRSCSSCHHLNLICTTLRREKSMGRRHHFQPEKDGFGMCSLYPGPSRHITGRQASPQPKY